MPLDLYNEVFGKLPSHNIALPLQTTTVLTSEAQRAVDQANAANAPDNQDPKGQRCELIDLTTIERPGGEHPRVAQTAHFKKPKENLDHFSDYALRVIRYVNKNGEDVGVGKRLEISSSVLQKVLRPFLAKHAFLNLAADPIVIPRPFAPIFHSQMEIRERYSKTTDATERQFLELLLEKFCKPYLGETERIFREEVNKGMVRWDLLWTLFQAEDDVIVQHNHYREVQRVMDYEIIEDVFVIYTWRWGYGAGKFGPCSETISIPKYSSTRRTEQLPCFPLRTVATPEEQNSIREELIARGRLWRKLIRPSHREYHGPVWRTNGGMNSMSETMLGHVKGRVVLDHELHSESCPRLNDQLIGVHGYRINGREAQGLISKTASNVNAIRLGTGGAERPVSSFSRAGEGAKVIFNQAQCHVDDDTYEMTDEEALLCPARTRGLSLTDKTWAFFLVEKMKEIDPSSAAFKSLAIDDDVKDTLLGLVDAHDPYSPTFDDVVEGKGRGVILSLEGPPGSGKTLTAESIAAKTKRILYNVSTSELGTEASVAERGLLSVFHRAERWKAVVLLDEADLFLTKRTEDQLDRNALVTVFLRTLEYFKGVLFLTSNRVEQFDVAFESRIHLRVCFSSPKAETREQIWGVLLPVHCDKEMARNLGRELEINGRQIKNLIRVAVLISKHQKCHISEDLIRKLYTTSLEAKQAAKQEEP